MDIGFVGYVVHLLRSSSGTRVRTDSSDCPKGKSYSIFLILTESNAYRETDRRTQLIILSGSSSSVFSYICVPDT